eukprot:10836829-Alexandrium_andersonii.AAC.1
MPELDRLPGRLVLGSEKGLKMLIGLMGRADTQSGWSACGSVKLNVAANAAGLRTPEPRLEPAEFPWRTSLAGYRLAVETPLVWR